MKELVIISFLFFAVVTDASEKMIEIDVEITEINKNKTRYLGIE